MKIIKPSYEILNLPSGDEIMKLLELAARTCYKSEDKITEGSAEDLIRRLIKSGHASVLEHISFSVRFICDRGITHELVRHRLCAFSQESTRYANYSKEKFGREITVIKPRFWPEDSRQYRIWAVSMGQAEKNYMELLDSGSKAQEARSVLPTCLKADIICSTNLREWLHIFNLRCAKASHPQIRELMLPLLDDVSQRVPVIFDDLRAKFNDDILEFRR